MAHLSIETSDREKPIMLLTGEKNSLARFIIHEYNRDFTIAYITNSQATKDTQDNIYRIRFDAAELLKNLEEKIEYAIVFLDAETKKQVPYIFEKLQKDKTKTAVIIDISEVETYKNVITHYKTLSNFFFIFLGDVYSENPAFNPSSPMGKLFEDMVHEKRITLTGGDMKPAFPIYYKDALTGINQVILGRGSKQKSYFLFYSHPQTYIAAVQIIEKAVPEVEISYTEDERRTYYKTREELEREVVEIQGLKPVYPDRYFEGFERSIQHFMDRGPVRRELPKIVDKPAKVFEKQKRKIKITSISLIWAFLIFLVLNAVLAGAAIFFFANSISAFRANDYNTMKNDLKAANVFFEITSPITQAVVKTTSLLGFRGLEDNYNLVTQGLSLLTIASSDFDAVAKISSGIERSLLESKIADAFYLYFTAAKLNEETTTQALNSVLTEDLTNVLAISQVFYQVAGYEKEKTYLLLFQNDAELRPTGGFIGSVGEMRVKNGKLEQLKLEDVYEHDGKLKVHIEPYFVIRRYLQKNLYLRDSNFDLDFQDAAAKAALIYNLEANKKVDGVIAINFEAVRRIIEEVGPINLSNYNQTLDGKNSFDFLEKTIDDNFFPGSTQKRDVLQALFDQLMLKLEDRSSVIKIARILPKLASEKQILFAFNELSVQSVFSSMSLGGEYKDRRIIETGESINDFLSVNEANIGVNKANVKVSRELSYTADLSDTKINSTVSYIITNSFDKEYKTYLRFVAPVGSKLTKIAIDGQNQSIVSAVTDFNVYEARTFKQPAGLEVNQNTEADYQVFGFLATVPPGAKQQIDVTYENGTSKSNGAKVSYSLLFIKQPGTKTFPFSLNLAYGEEYSPNVVQNAKLEEGNVVITKEVLKDTEFNVSLLKR
jgi:hypothetical protein